MSRKLTEAQKAQALEKSRVIGDLLIRVTRHFLSCVTAPNREENRHAEELFHAAFNDLVVTFLESDL